MYQHAHTHKAVRSLPPPAAFCGFISLLFFPLERKEEKSGLRAFCLRSHARTHAHIPQFLLLLVIRPKAKRESESENKRDRDRALLFSLHLLGELENAKKETGYIREKATGIKRILLLLIPWLARRKYGGRELKTKAMDRTCSQRSSLFISILGQDETYISMALFMNAHTRSMEKTVATQQKSG